MSILKKVSLILTIVFVVILTAACGEKSISTKQSSVTKETIFDFYNKVQLDQTKEQVDAQLGVAGTEDKSLKNSITYTDEKTSYGVSVYFGDANKVTSKTLIYPERKDIAFLCGKKVTQAQADKIKKGMTYEKVKSELGGDGIEINTSQIPFDDNKLSYIRIWVNSDGSMIQIVFGTDGNSNDAIFFDA